MSTQHRWSSGNDPSSSHIIVEIRAAEGGNDAKLLVREQLTVYLRWIQRERL